MDLWPTYGISLSFLLLTTLEDATTQQTTLKGHDIESWIKDLCIKNNCSEVILNLLNLELKHSRDYGLKRDEEILFKYLKLIIQEEPSVSDGKRAKRSKGTVMDPGINSVLNASFVKALNDWYPFPYEGQLFGGSMPEAYEGFRHTWILRKTNGQ